MTKHEFLARLRDGLSGIPKDEIEERLTFYSEMIDDRMEEGIPEEEAVRGLGSVEELLRQIVAEVPLSKIVREKMTVRQRPRGWMILLLILGFPVWFPLLVAGGAVLLALYVSVWAILLSLWAVFASLCACGAGTVLGGIGFAVGGNALTGIVAVGTGLVCAGLSVFVFFGCRAVSAWVLRLTGAVGIGLKRRLVGKEKEQ